MVDKYDLVYRSRGYDSWREMVREQDGDWVRAEDHEAELAALRAERDAHLAMATDMLRDCDALRARVAALETTIERHNEGCEEACEWRKSHGHCTGYVERNMRCIDCPSDNVIELPVPSAGASNTPVPDQFLPFRVEEQTGAYPHQNEWEVWTAGDDDTAFQVAVCNSQLMAEAIAHYGRELLQRAHPRQEPVR